MSAIRPAPVRPGPEHEVAIRLDHVRVSTWDFTDRMTK